MVDSVVSRVPLNVVVQAVAVDELEVVSCRRDDLRRACVVVDRQRVFVCAVRHLGDVTVSRQAVITTVTLHQRLHTTRLSRYSSDITN